MLDMRLHIVMGSAIATLWCTRCTPHHVIWKGTQYVGPLDHEAAVIVLYRAAMAAREAAAAGRLYELPPECVV